MKKSYRILAMSGILIASLLTGCKNNDEKTVSPSSSIENNENQVIGRVVSIGDNELTIISMGRMRENREPPTDMEKPDFNGKDIKNSDFDDENMKKPDFENGDFEKPNFEGKEFNPRDGENNFPKNFGNEKDMEETIKLSGNVEIILSDGNIGTLQDINENDMVLIEKSNDLATKIEVRDFKKFDVAKE